MDLLSPQSRFQFCTDGQSYLEAIGLKVTELDLRKYFRNPSDLKKTLASANLIWVRGGNVFVLRRAMKQSGFDQLLAPLLNEPNWAYGGDSAGALVLGPSLRGIESIEDPVTVPPEYDPEVIWDGLGLLPYSVLPHFQSNHPASADVGRLARHFEESHRPYQTLRDGEVLIVDKKAPPSY